MTVFVPSLTKIIVLQLRNQYSMLTSKEKKLINIEYIEEKLLAISSRLNNVREIEKIVQDMISLILLRDLLEK